MASFAVTFRYPVAGAFMLTELTFVLPGDPTILAFPDLTVLLAAA
jgi:hypothetical protein